MKFIIFDYLNSKAPNFVFGITLYKLKIKSNNPSQKVGQTQKNDKIKNKIS